jgi:hypothetical protein
LSFPKTQRGGLVLVVQGNSTFEHCTFSNGSAQVSHCSKSYNNINMLLPDMNITLGNRLYQLLHTLILSFFKTQAGGLLSFLGRGTSTFEHCTFSGGRASNVS